MASVDALLMEEVASMTCLSLAVVVALLSDSATVAVKAVAVAEAADRPSL